MPGEVVIIDRHKGQLGNRLMFFAAAYAFAVHEGRRLRFPTFARYAEYFPALAGSPWCEPDAAASPGAGSVASREAVEAWVGRRRLLAKLRVLPGVVRKPSGLRAVALAPTAEFPSARRRRTHRLYLPAWRFFNPEGVRRHRGEILSVLRMRDDLVADAAAFTAELRRDCLWLGAHVRGKDYAGFLGGKHHHTPEFVAEHLRAAAAALAPRAVGFVVFSDEPRREEDFPGVRVVVSGGAPMQDFARMTRLPGLVGPMSTFTAFAMFMAGGAAWHIGPSCDEDGLGWVYAGYPIVRSAGALAEAVRAVERDGRWAPPVSPVDPRPRKG